MPFALLAHLFIFIAVVTAMMLAPFNGEVRRRMRKMIRLMRRMVRRLMIMTRTMMVGFITDIDVQIKGQSLQILVQVAYMNIFI